MPDKYNAQEYSRPQRVADQIQRELAVIIQQDMKDPRVGMTTVSAVELSRDLSHAKVFVSFLTTEKDAVEGIVTPVKILNQASSFLRSKLGQRMQLRAIPSLRFHYDKSLQQGNYLSNLIDQAIAKNKA